jgi:hypothetical protein
MLNSLLTYVPTQVSIDIANGRLDVNLSDAEMAKRRAAWKIPPEVDPANRTGGCHSYVRVVLVHLPVSSCACSANHSTSCRCKPRVLLTLCCLWLVSLQACSPSTHGWSGAPTTAPPRTEVHTQRRRVGKANDVGGAKRSSPWRARVARSMHRVWACALWPRTQCIASHVYWVSRALLSTG